MALVWIDIDNLPHIPIFQPLIGDLRERGHEVLLTVRDFAYSVEKLEDSGLSYRVIGRHYGKSKFRKVSGTLWRAWQLYRYLASRPVALAVSHSSRSAILAAWLRGLPTVAMYDYEHVSTTLQERFADYLLVPELLLQTAAVKGSAKYRGYPGYKEEIYLADFRPDPAFREQLGVPAEALFAVLRPPATEAHYHNPAAERLLEALLARLEREQVFTIIMPRTPRQAEEFSRLSSRTFQVLSRPVDGLNLISAADFVISGGGTMNREAALLGTPVYSFFQGTMGALDRQLAAEGKLYFLTSASDVSRIPLERASQQPPQAREHEVRAFVSHFLGNLLNGD